MDGSHRAVTLSRLVAHGHIGVRAEGRRRGFAAGEHGVEGMEIGRQATAGGGEDG